MVACDVAHNRVPPLSVAERLRDLSIIHVVPKYIPEYFVMRIMRGEAQTLSRAKLRLTSGQGRDSHLTA